MDALLGLVRHSGNDALFKAVEMSLLSSVAGVPLHIHAEGLRGTGKTTILRAVRRLLPRIRRVQGCLYNCDPAGPHCPRHGGMSPQELEAEGTEWIPMPFLEISHSAKVGTVIGSIDLGRLVNPAEPSAALLPGTLPQAHRGIVFVDEINRLAETSPELADVLLDAMGTKPGRAQIEETGLPAVELPLSVSVWAASNPDEDPGPLEEIRRQLSDRFDFVIHTTRPAEPGVVAQILARFDTEASAITGHLSGRPVSGEAARLESYRGQMAGRVGRLAQAEVPGWLRFQVAEIYARFGLESLRAAQAMLWGMRLAAVLAERQQATWEDMAVVAPLALHHRVDNETLHRVVQFVRSLQNRGERSAVGLSAGGVADAVGAGWTQGQAAPPQRSTGTGLAAQAALPADNLTREAAEVNRLVARAADQPGTLRGIMDHSSCAPGTARTVARPDGQAPDRQASMWHWIRQMFHRPEDAAGSPGPVRAGEGRAGGSASAPGPSLTRRPDPPPVPRMGAAAGQGAQGGASSSTGPGTGLAAPGAAPGPLADPARMQVTAPPVAARRISTLASDELVRTGSELGGDSRWTGPKS